jgi:transcriptional adapter 3
MSSRLSPYVSPEPIHSSLFKNPSEVVPPTEDLEFLQKELRDLKSRTLERARKASEDWKTIDLSMRRIKEKGKARAVEKIKREPECAYIPRKRVR